MGGDPQGVLRVVNDADAAAAVSIHAIDDAGVRTGPATLTLDASAAVQLSATGLGRLAGDVRLVLDSDLPVVPSAYVRAADGTLGAMHDTVRAASSGTSGPYRYEVPVFNPSTEVTQVSRLRLINPGDAAAAVANGARDDGGAEATGGEVTLTLAAGCAKTLTARQLETGDADITGRLGAGTGKWRLTVSSDRPLQVVNIVATFPQNRHEGKYSSNIISH
ncbi:MAG: hypothetical protein OXB97_08300 [Rhodospirillales bacterium]|nr:hypothetical protein [Rhodospirillales bacterium]